MALTKERKNEIIKKYARDEKDTGSPEVQIAILTEEIKVLNYTELENFLKENAIDIAIISVQKELAEEVAKKVISAGIKSIWNFAPTDLYFAGDVVCENINMSESLMRLIYRSKKIED